MNIPFETNSYDDNTEGWFELPASLEDYQVDIKMEGNLPFGRKIDVKIYDEDDNLLYSNVITMCEYMGLYITIAHNQEKKFERFHYVFSEKIEIKKIFLRDTPYDICDIGRYMTEQAYANQQYTCDFAKNKELRITWFVTWLCNYKCPYCWERVDESQYRNKLSKLNQISPEMWANAFNQLEPDEIYITGGEPTIYQQLPEVIRNLKQGIYLKMTTNFGDTFHLESYREFIQQGRFRGVTASFHPSEIPLEKFLEKIDKALSLGYGDNCAFEIELVMYPQDIQYAHRLLDYCYKKKIRLQLDYYSDPRAQYKETKEEKEIIDELIWKSKINNQALRRMNQEDITKMSDEAILALDKVVLCGAGINGTKLCNKLLRKKYSGIKGFCDNYIGDLGRKRSDIDIYSFEIAVKKFPDAYFVITVENTAIASEMAVRLAELGVNKKRIKVYEKSTIAVQKFIRGRQPIWCPAGMISLHIDPEGEVYPCMVAINNKKTFGADTMPSYKAMGNILEQMQVNLRKTPLMCWESFRCSTCDYYFLENGMTNVDIVNTEKFLHLPE